MLEVISAIHLHQINVVGQTGLGNQIATATILDPTGIVTTLPDGSTPPTRPAIVGDVYSIQLNGDVQGRVAGTAAAYEKFAIVGPSCVWNPGGPGLPAYIAPYVADVPNA